MTSPTLPPRGASAGREVAAGRTVAEAPARLGIPQTAVRSRAYHALRALHAAIGTPYGEKT